jgi:hypothetical protein
MIQIATAVHQMTGLPWRYILWELPAAIAYQIHILYWQRQGAVYYKDQTARIRRRLMREEANAR